MDFDRHVSNLFITQCFQLIGYFRKDEKVIKKKNVFLNNGRDFKDNFILLNEIA